MSSFGIHFNIVVGLLDGGKNDPEIDDHNF